jgi:hypothetical protein
VVAISETGVASEKRNLAIGIDGRERPRVNDVACFNDWMRFFFVLREIASGKNDRPLSGLEAQKRAQAVLTECGYKWPETAIESQR